jgi:hypothetical protein
LDLQLEGRVPMSAGYFQAILKLAEVQFLSVLGS